MAGSTKEAIGTKAQYLTVGLEWDNGSPVIPVKSLQFVDQGLVKTIENVKSESMQNVLNNLVFIGSGSKTVDGPLELELSPIESVRWFLLALGKITSADISSLTDWSVYKHTIEEEVCFFKSISLEHKTGECGLGGSNDGQTTMVKRAYGTVLDSLALNIEPNAYAKLSIGMKAFGMFDAAKLIANESVEAATTVITNFTRAAQILTVTSVAHGLAAGDLAKLDGNNPAAVDGYYKVLTIVDADNFTVSLETDPWAFTAGGTVNKIAMFYFAKGTVKGLVAGDTVKFFERATGTYEDVVIAYVDAGSDIIGFDSVISSLFTVANNSKIELLSNEPSYDAPIFFTFDDFKIKEGNTLAEAETADNMNIEKATFNIAKNVVEKLMSVNNITAPTGMDADINVEKLYNSNEERDDFVNRTEKAYIIELTNNQVVSATDTNNAPYKVKIFIPKTIKSSFEMTNAKNELIGESFVTDIIHDTDTAYSIKVEITNDKIGTFYTG